MLQLAMARLEGKDIKSTDEIATLTDKKVEVSNESEKGDAVTTTTTPVTKVSITDTPENASTPVTTVVVDSTDVKVPDIPVVTPKVSTTEPISETIVDVSTTTTTNDSAKKSSLQEQLSKTMETPVVKEVTDNASSTNENMDALATEFRVYTKDFLLRYVEWTFVCVIWPIV